MPPLDIIKEPEILARDSTLIQPDGTIDLIPSAAATLSKGYLEGAFKWETTPRGSLPPSWYNWAIRFLRGFSRRWRLSPRLKT